MIRKVISYKLWVIGLITLLTYNSSFITHHYCFAQDNSILVTLTKQIMESKSNKELFASFEELRDLYFSENKYNELIEFLNSLIKQKKDLEPIVNYYLAFTRLHQLKYLEEAQGWDEYFSQGNNYRDQLTQSAQKAIDSFTPQDIFSVYSRLILWKFHRHQEDALTESALSELMNSISTYVKDAKNLTPLKEMAQELSASGEKVKAKTIYGLYVNKLLASDIKDEVLNTTALSFYQEGNLDLAESIYDAYIEKISPTKSKEKLSALLIDIAKLFSYRDKEPNDPFYAEKVFKKIEAVGGRDAFNEELMYLRAFNLEKAKEYKSAKDGYVELLQRFPQAAHRDEADFKLGIIYTYILRDAKTGKTYFEKLSQKEIVNPQVISGLYQLGLLSQWEGDVVKAKEYYHQLIEKAGPVRNTESLGGENKISNGAGSSFAETVGLTNQRLKEIAAEKPIEYNLKTFLDASLKEEYAMLDMSRLDLRAQAYAPKKEESVDISSTPYVAESGCLVVELQYLWSGHLGVSKPRLDESAFSATYTQAGSKEINLVVVSPNGILDRNLDILDVY